MLAKLAQRLAVLRVELIEELAAARIGECLEYLVGVNSAA
jgi:hypothetical protein